MADTLGKRSQYLLDMIQQSKGTGSGPMGTHQTRWGPLVANVPVSVLSSIIIWAFAIYCMVEPDDAKANLGDAKSAVTGFFTWAYIGSNGVWFFFIIALYYWYGDVKLGLDDEKPEFDDANYFAMIFCAGVAIGLFFYGASEPLYHYYDAGGNRFTGKTSSLNDNEKAQWAINLTLYHWGVHGWVVYTLTALCLGILSYRYGLPLTYRTCFFPVFGKVTWGWIGDLIDSCTIAGCIAGVCTSLGLGAQQIVTGMQRIGIIDPTCAVVAAANATGALEADITEDCMSEAGITASRCILIACITVCATISVVSGVNYGIKLLSQVAFGSGMVLWCVAFILDDTWYILNLMVQAFGFYLQWIIQLGWFTDAFAQLGWGEGKAIDTKGANPAWMDWWTIFYWGWWIAWSPFVGVFLARISRGRTVKEVINFTFSIPLIYCILWFCTFGGGAIRMHRRAELLKKAGTELYADATHFQAELSSGATNCYDVPEKLYADCPEKPEGMDDATWKNAVWPARCPAYAEAYATDTRLSPVCLFDDSNADGYWFDLMTQYYHLGPMLCGFSIFTIIIYFVTSSDSGSLVVDYIASNGEEAHWSQRVYWAFTEGLLAIALLAAGGTEALKGLQAVSIISGVPLTIFVCFICMSLWMTLKCEKGEFFEGQFTNWAMPLYGGIFDYLEFVFSFGKSPLPKFMHVPGFLVSLFCPAYVLFLTCKRIASMGATTRIVYSVFAFLLWIAVLFCGVAQYVDRNTGFQGIQFFCYCGFCTLVVAVRLEVRTMYNIEGGGLRDSLASFCMYPLAVWQSYIQVTEVEVPEAPKPLKQEEKVADQPPSEAAEVNQQGTDV